MKLVAIVVALGACADSNPYEGYDLTVWVRSPIALDQLKVYYDTTGGLLPAAPAPTASELAADHVAAEWSNVLAIDVVDVTPRAQTITYENNGHGPRFVAVIGIAGATMVAGGTVDDVSYLDGPDSDPIPTAIASETLDLVAL